MNEFENYTMDVFYEYMIKRKYTVKEYLKIAGFAVLFLFLAVLMLVGSLYSLVYLPFLNQILLIAFAAAIYFGYVMISRQNVEFEYSLTNSDLDIDKIIAKRRRVDVISLDVKEIEEMGKLKIETYKNSPVKTLVLGNIDTTAYYIICKDSDEQSVRVIFNPPTKMVEGIRKFAKGKVID